MNELPMRCRCCHYEQMVDLDKLESWTVDKLTSARGYKCTNCESWQVISYTTRLMDDQLERLTEMLPTHRKFPYHFRKALNRMESINRRNNGTRGHSDLATT